MLTGEAITNSVKSGLNRAIAVVVVLSSSSLESQWVLFELGFAMAQKKRILPFIIEKGLILPSYIQDFRSTSSLIELEDVLIKCTTNKHVIQFNLEPLEWTALTLINQDESVDSDYLSFKLHLSKMATNQLMNNLKRLDLVTCRYTDKGKKWEMDYDGRRLMNNTTEIYPMERMVLGLPLIS